MFCSFLVVCSECALCVLWVFSECSVLFCALSMRKEFFVELIMSNLKSWHQSCFPIVLSSNSVVAIIVHLFWIVFSMFFYFCWFLDLLHCCPNLFPHIAGPAKAGATIMNRGGQARYLLHGTVPSPSWWGLHPNVGGVRDNNGRWMTNFQKRRGFYIAHGVNLYEIWTSVHIWFCMN